MTSFNYTDGATGPPHVGVLSAAASASASVPPSSFSRAQPEFDSDGDEIQDLDAPSESSEQGDDDDYRRTVADDSLDEESEEELEAESFLNHS